MKTGAVIVAAGMSTRMKQFKQLMKVGNVTMAERVIVNFQRAGIKDIVMVTGHKSEELEKAVGSLNVHLLKNLNYKNTEMFESAKIGLSHIQQCCDRILFCPVDVAFFTDETVDRLLECDADAVYPVYNGKRGHPILIKSRLVPDILKFRGDGGLKQALSEIAKTHIEIPVDDRGSVMDADTQEDYQKLVDLHNERILHPVVNVMLANGNNFFGTDTVNLLIQIEKLGSVIEAAEKAGISYSKAWNVIKSAENGLGYRIVERKNGGKDGGSSALTYKGSLLIKLYLELQKRLEHAADEEYRQIFLNSDLF